MALFNGKRVNAELEALRDSVKPVTVEETVRKLIEVSTDTPARCLFHPYGKGLLIKLCRCFSGTPDSLRFKGWRDLGDALRLDLEQLNVKECFVCSNRFKYFALQCIQNIWNPRFNKECQTYNTFLVYIHQNQGATVADVIKAIDGLPRQDVINEIETYVLDLAKQSQCIDASAVELPEVPQCLAFPVGKDPKPLLEKSTLVASENDSSQTQQRYSKTVLLTFASDGVNYANHIAKTFRQLQNGKKIGAVILQEHADKVHVYAEQFITDIFEQVDFVVPIITEDYLHIVSSDDVAIVSSLGSLDCKYVKFIHKLIMTNYRRNSCRNKKVRVVIPDDKVYRFYDHPVLRIPTYQVWVRSGEVQKLKERILDTNF